MKKLDFILNINFNPALAFLVLLALNFIAQPIQAQKVSFTASAPKVVSEGERFRFVYTTNAQGTNIQPGKFEGFALLSGPSTSQSTSIQMSGGKTVQQFEVTYTYILQAQKEGKFTIPSGKLIVDGKEYTSNPVSIEVVKAQNPTANKPNSNLGGATAPAPNNNKAAGDLVGADDLFLRMLISKREVLKGEPIVVTLKLYTKVNLSDLGAFKAPAFNGFWSETLREARNLSFQRENVNGQIYNAAVVQQHVLIPERTGELTIDPSELTAAVQVRVQNRRSRSVFDQFFGAYQNVEKTLRSPKITLMVNPLPTSAPPSYSGAIGNINIKATLEPSETKTNEAVTFKVTYSGTGNLKLLSEPKINFPSDFEVYDPKVSNNYSAGANGYSGSKVFEYLLIPRHKGDFEIPEIRFSAFDLESKIYKQNTVGPFPIHVAKGEEGSMTAIDLSRLKEDVQVVGSDIRYIKTNAIELRKKDRPFFGSGIFYGSYLISLALFFGSFLLLRKQRKQRDDIVFMKNKKAGRVAQSRLKKAKAFLDKQNSGSFYNEVLTGLWGYLSDKLNISQGKLDKQKVTMALSSRQVDTNITNELLDLMNRCEYAQFAPNGGSDELTTIYDQTAHLIDQLEKEFKK